MTLPSPPFYIKTGPLGVILACLLVLLIPASERISSHTPSMSVSFFLHDDSPLRAIQIWATDARQTMADHVHAAHRAGILFVQAATDSIAQTVNTSQATITEILSQGSDVMAGTFHEIASRIQSVSITPFVSDFLHPRTALEPAAGTGEPVEPVHTNNVSATIDTPPPSAPPRDDQPAFLRPTATETVEGILVPQRMRVISSSRDGRIKRISVDHGDSFRAGDILIEYECDDLDAERESALHEKKYLEKRSEAGWRLLNLGMISDLDALDMQTEAKQAEARIKLHKARESSCTIRADYDGHVTNRLAHDGEYTRTDRVLLEIAATLPLRIEFLMPSSWLRWVNRDAPFTLTLNENGKNYSGRIVKIHGRVDPISQSIQVIGQLDSYTDPLLPGMSGEVTLDSRAIADAGITGFLDAP